MRKKWLLITDFDNTMSEKDFYHIIIDDYVGEEARNYYLNYKAEGGIIGTTFLNKIFSWQQFTEAQRDEMLGKVAIDKDSENLIAQVEALGGDLVVMSAGFDYYINETFKRLGMKDLTVMTNPGAFENGSFVMKPDTASPYYSEVYGIDKGKALLGLKEDYDLVIFIGDSEPDYHAAIHADVVFAKSELKDLMERSGKDFYPIDDYSDVLKVLEEVVEGALK